MHIFRDVKIDAHACTYITQKKRKTLILNSSLGNTVHFQVHVPTVKLGEAEPLLAAVSAPFLLSPRCFAKRSPNARYLPKLPATHGDSTKLEGSVGATSRAT